MSTPCAEARRQPNWLVCLLLPLLHYASVKLTFMTALSPENSVVVWLPNAVLLAALLHYRGRRGWLLAGLTFSSDVIANLPMFPTVPALLLSACNLAEVLLAFALLRRLGADPSLARIADFGKFVVAGPVLGALLAALLAANVLQAMDGVSASYPTLVLLWWFGDALGLLIWTPLLLALVQRQVEPPRLNGFDLLVGALTLTLALLIFSGRGAQFGEILLTPNLLLPGVLYIAVRFGIRWTALAVALIALATAWAQTTGHQPFGDASPHGMILRTQEFILTLSIVGMGFAILFGEQRALARGLEAKVLERTHELEESNRKLAALSAIDGLTGIANRRQFDEVLAREWARCQRTGQSLALVLFDVDHFKEFNDCYGHQAGDDCLRLVAGELAAGVRRGTDFVARYGGEEFVLVAPGADAVSALAIAQGISDALRARGQCHERSSHGVVTLSAGVAVCAPDACESAQALLKRADQALYAAKAAGRSQVRLA